MIRSISSNGLRATAVLAMAGYFAAVGCKSHVEGEGDDAGADSGAPVDAQVEPSHGPRAIAVGEHAVIWELRDDGWTYVEPPLEVCIDPSCEDPFSPALNSVAFLDADRAIAVGTNGLTVLREGEGWRRVDDATSPMISVVASGGGRVIGAAGTELYELVDGVWESMGDPLGSELPELRIIDIDLSPDGSSGFAVGGTFSDTGDLHGVVLELVEEDWQIVRQGEDRTLVSVATNGVGVAYGGFADFLAGDGLNMRWRPVADEPFEPVEGPWRRFVTGIDFGPDFGVAVTDGGGTGESTEGAFFLRFDGTRWEAAGTAFEVLGESSAFDDACAIDSSSALAVGNHIAIVYDGSEWSEADLESTLTSVEEDVREEYTYLRAVACAPPG